jgi:hypothetical protein
MGEDEKKTSVAPTPDERSVPRVLAVVAAPASPPAQVSNWRGHADLRRPPGAASLPVMPRRARKECGPRVSDAAGGG